MLLLHTLFFDNRDLFPSLFWPPLSISPNTGLTSPSTILDLATTHFNNLSTASWNPSPPLNCYPKLKPFCTFAAVSAKNCKEDSRAVLIPLWCLHNSNPGWPSPTLTHALTSLQPASLHVYCNVCPEPLSPSVPHPNCPGPLDLQGKPNWPLCEERRTMWLPLASSSPSSLPFQRDWRHPFSFSRPHHFLLHLSVHYHIMAPPKASNSPPQWGSTSVYCSQHIWWISPHSKNRKEIFSLTRSSDMSYFFLYVHLKE